MARIYISSTFKDLIDERREVRDAVLTLGHLPVAMETYTATARRPLDQCLADVASCDAYVGIFAWRYGFIPKGEANSITELEYEEAGRCNVPRLIFVLHDNATWPQNRVDRRQDRIREFRRRLLDEHTAGLFDDAKDLAAKVTAAVSRLLGTGAPIPDLLPYSSDRSDQEIALEDAFAGFCRDDPPKPLVAVVHGDEHQCHDKFVERLEKVTLPGILGLDTQRTVESVFVPWPRRFRDRGALRGRLLKGLAERVLRRRTASAKEINDALRPGPVVVHTHLMSADWRRHGIETLHGFLDFWQDWPELAPGQRLLACFFVKYELETQDAGIVERALRRFRGGGSASDDVASALEAFDFAPWDGVTGVVLPCLEGVERAHVWPARGLGYR